MEPLKAFKYLLAVYYELNDFYWLSYVNINRVRVTSYIFNSDWLQCSSSKNTAQRYFSFRKKACGAMECGQDRLATCAHESLNYETDPNVVKMYLLTNER
jgi:hypothetical protein